jgi:hypothetical protein
MNQSRDRDADEKGSGHWWPAWMPEAIRVRMRNWVRGHLESARQFVAGRWGVVIITAYALFVVAALVLVGIRSRHQARRDAAVDWMEKKDIEISAKPSGTWTWVYEYIKGPALIKFEASDAQWKYASNKQCTADGDLRSMVNTQNCIVPGAPIGALVAKIGGGTAGTKDGRVFVVGQMCIVEIDQNTSGPILLTMNDELTGMANHEGSIKVSIYLKRLEVPPSQSQPIVAVPAPVVNAPVVQPGTAGSSGPVSSGASGPIVDKK